MTEIVLVKLLLHVPNLGNSNRLNNLFNFFKAASFIFVMRFIMFVLSCSIFCDSFLKALFFKYLHRYQVKSGDLSG